MKYGEMITVHDLGPILCYNLFLTIKASINSVTSQSLTAAVLESLVTTGSQTRMLDTKNCAAHCTERDTSEYLQGQLHTY